MVSGLLPAYEWGDLAACRDAPDPDVFFPLSGRSSPSARVFCQDCPVTEECLAHALSLPEKFGIWGGTSERERKSLKKRLRRVAGVPSDVGGSRG